MIEEGLTQMEKLTQEAEKVFKQLFAVVDLLHHLGYMIPWNGVKRNRFFIAPGETHYLYIVELEVDSANKLFLEVGIGIASRKFLTDITVEDVHDFHFEFQRVTGDEVLIDEDGHPYKKVIGYELRWFFKGECIVSFPVEISYSDFEKIW